MVGKWCFFTRRVKNPRTLPSCPIPEGDGVNVHLQQSWPPELAFSPVLFLHSFGPTWWGEDRNPSQEFPGETSRVLCCSIAQGGFLTPTRSWFLQTLKGVEMELPRWGSENTSRLWQHLRGFWKLCTRFLFCFVHRPLKESAVTTSKGSLSHHSPPMSCQESVMAQVHP